MRIRESARQKKGSNFCGPVALSMVTGRDREEITELIKRLRCPASASQRTSGRVRSMFCCEIIDALCSLGFWCESFVPDKGVTLARFLRERRGSLLRLPLIVVVTDHCLAIQGRKGGGSCTRGRLVWLRDLPYRRARVLKVIIVKRKGG